MIGQRAVRNTGILSVALWYNDRTMCDPKRRIRIALLCRDYTVEPLLEKKMHCVRFLLCACGIISGNLSLKGNSK